MTTVATAGVTLDRRLQFGEFSYDYHIRSGPGAWDEFTARLAPMGADRFALVVSEGVPPRFVDRMQECLKAAAHRAGEGVIVLKVPDGEGTKTLTAVRDMAVTAFRNGLTRRSVVVAFGGGKAANMAGLLAGLALRGVRHVHVPTTWLNMWDGAGASLKQAVNLFDELPAAPGRQGGLPAGRAVGKNLIGLFKAPEFVFGITDVIGCLIAVRVSIKLGYLDPAAETLLDDLVRRNGLVPMLPPGPSDQELRAALDHDNKKGELPEMQGRIAMVLLDDLGVPHYTDGIPLTQVPAEAVLEAFHSRISAKEPRR